MPSAYVHHPCWTGACCCSAMSGTWAPPSMDRACSSCGSG